MIHKAAISITGRYKSKKANKLLTGTKQLREKCRQIRRNITQTDSIEYSKIWKAIQLKKKGNIHKQDEEQITEAIKNSKSIFNREEEGAHIHYKVRIVKRCVTFYEELHIDLNELPLIKTHMVTQKRPIPLTHHPYYH